MVLFDWINPDGLLSPNMHHGLRPCSRFENPDKAATSTADTQLGFGKYDLYSLCIPCVAEGPKIQMVKTGLNFL